MNELVNIKSILQRSVLSLSCSRQITLSSKQAGWRIRPVSKSVSAKHANKIFERVWSRCFVFTIKISDTFIKTGQRTGNEAKNNCCSEKDMSTASGEEDREESCLGNKLYKMFLVPIEEDSFIFALKLRWSVLAEYSPNWKGNEK